MPHNYSFRYERAPGKYIYVPTKASLETGTRIVERVLKRYQPHPIFYHFGARGGHVAALRCHLQSSHFAKFDLQNFYGHVTRTKIIRSLQNLRFAQQAFSWAVDSVVVEGAAKVLPQGFRQSPLLATLVLEQSALGTVLRKLATDLTVTVYMDDIIVSSQGANVIEQASELIVQSSDEAGFPLSQAKTALVSPSITAFNCDLTHRRMQVADARLQQFRGQWQLGNAYVREGIETYLAAVNEDDLVRLAALTNTSA